MRGPARGGLRRQRDRRPGLSPGQPGELDAVLVHFSTDYVFDGEKRTPYVEQDPPGPLSVYAASKLAGSISSGRTRGGPSSSGPAGFAGRLPGKGRHFVAAMLQAAESGRKEIRVVDDQVVTPTTTAELRRADRRAPPDRRLHGLYHMTAEGSCSWADFARAVFELSGRIRRSSFLWIPAALGAKAAAGVFRS